MESEQAELVEIQLEEEQETEEPAEGEQPTAEEKVREQEKSKNETVHEEDRSSFIHGLSVGLGMGCITTFIVMWIAVFFSPMLPPTITYESMLSVFIYPLLYLLAIGLIALTAGIVKEYYVRKE
ncbi:MAG: hypothetical protein NZ932_01620 [Candidatus Bathyarchaeota archaeon]|nr:hypothetical protein [Candidatus Bathyarchaeota archaeon]MDW8040048.1 hypothetical protein [Nitrososphaerota archaeon]